MVLREDFHGLSLECRKQVRKAFREQAGPRCRKPGQEAERLGLRVIPAVSYLTECPIVRATCHPGLLSKILSSLESWKKSQLSHFTAL